MHYGFGSLASIGKSGVGSIGMWKRGTQEGPSGDVIGFMNIPWKLLDSRSHIPVLEFLGDAFTSVVCWSPIFWRASGDESNREAQGF